MFDLTRQERLVLISLLFIFLVGITLHYTCKKSPRFNRIVNLLEGDQLYHKADINTAAYDELVNLPYIGPVTAKRIIVHREQSGSFKNIEELKNIGGIGNYNYQKIVKFVKVSKDLKQNPEALSKPR